MTTSIELPVAIEAIVTCPKCDDVVDVPISLHGRLVADDDGTGEIKVRMVQKAVSHVCAQTRLDQVLEGGIERGTVTVSTDDRSVTIDQASLRKLRSVAARTTAEDRDDGDD